MHILGRAHSREVGTLIHLLGNALWRTLHRVRINPYGPHVCMDVALWKALYRLAVGDSSSRISGTLPHVLVTLPHVLVTLPHVLVTLPHGLVGLFLTS